MVKMFWFLTGTKFSNISNIFNRSVSTSSIHFYWAGQTSAVCEVAKIYQDRVAIKDTQGEHTYDHLFQQSEKLSRIILDRLSKREKKNQAVIAHLTLNNANYVLAQWAVWKSGHISLPLHPNHPSSLIQYYLNDSETPLILTTPELAPKLNCDADSSEVVVMNEELFYQAESLPYTTARTLAPKIPALMLYTSGTTGPPKGVVTTHGNISAMLDNMIEAWKWTKNDVILHTLPLHHTHGLINALLCPLRVGATVVMLPKFDPEQVWDELLKNDPNGRRVNVFMAVPSIYAKLLEEYEKKYGSGNRTKAFIKATCSQKMRLMVSGSAALPDPIFEKWKEVTGHDLLERYGMTEIGMALTNPLEGPRKQGFVGNPFPSVKVRICKLNSYSSLGYDIIADGTAHRTKVTPGCEKEEGEIWVTGPSVFKEYWNKPEATAAAFSKDGWFKTGDTAKYLDGAYKILGRTSVDIIKSGGYKISALDIERHLLSHPSIRDCSVVGLDDETWGQKIAAVVVLRENESLDLLTLKTWCKDRLAPYSLPSVLKVVETLPRNAMGKINKKELVRDLFSDKK